MAAYLIGNVDAKDLEKMKAYSKATPEVIKKFGGRFLVRGGDFWVVEGNYHPKRLVVVEFESAEKIKEFLNSKEYAPLRAQRQAAADTDMIIVEGITREMAEELK